MGLYSAKLPISKEWSKVNLAGGFPLPLRKAWARAGAASSVLKRSWHFTCVDRAFLSLFRGGANKMSESSYRESHDPLAFGGEDTESEEPSEYVCYEVDSQEAEYREMQRNYKVLKVVANRVLALPHTPKVGSSNQASPSGSVGIAVALASEGVDIRLAELRTNYSVPPYVGLRLPTAADVVRYPPEGSMMLAKLGYASGQYNPNFWLLLHGVYIVWWLVGLGEPTFEQFMYLYSISKQQGSFGWVQANCRKANERGYFIGHKPSTQKSWRNRWCLAYECLSALTLGSSTFAVQWGPISKEQEDEDERVRSLLSETKRECKNLVTQKNLLEFDLLQGMIGIIKGSTKVAVDLDDAEMQKQLRESRAQMAGKGVARQATRKRPRDDDEGLVADVLGKKRALEEAHWSVMGTGPRLPPFDLQAPSKLPLGMEDVYVEGVEKMDFSRLRRQKKEVNLAMHR
ncbi:unnamed protein product [Prunus armeniaca]